MTHLCGVYTSLEKVEQSHCHERGVIHSAISDRLLCGVLEGEYRRHLSASLTTQLL